MTHSAIDIRNSALPGLRRADLLSIVAVIGLTLVAAFFILPGARHLAIFGDEMRTWRDALGKSYFTILTWRHNADHAPLSYLLVKLTCDVFGKENGAFMRLPSVICGLLSIPAAFWLGRCVWSNALGLLVASFAAVDVSLIWQSQQARMYPLLMLVMLVGLVQIVKLADGGGLPRRRWVLLGLILGIGMWTHIASIVLWVAVLVLVGFLIRQRHRDDTQETKRIAIGAGVSIGIGLLLSSPALFRLAGIAERDTVESDNFPSIVSQINFTAKELSGDAFLAGVLGLLMAGGLVWMAVQKPQRRSVAIILLTVGILTGVNLLITAFWRPVLGAAYLTSASPSLWIGMGWILLWGFSNPNLFVREGVGLLLAAHLGFQAYRCTDLVNIFGTHQYANEFARAVKLILKSRMPGDQVMAVPPLPQLHRQYYKLQVTRGMDIDMRGIVKASSARLPILIESRRKKWGQHDTYILAVAPPALRDRGTPVDPRKFLPAVGKVFGVPVDVSKLPTRKPTHVYVYKITSKGSWVFNADGKEIASKPRSNAARSSTTQATTKP